MWYDVWYHSQCCSCIRFVSDAGISDRVDDTQKHAASDSESERAMDSIEARDFADILIRNLDPDDPDGPGSTNDPNFAILAAILKSNPECIEAEDFERLSDLLPDQEDVEVATRTVQEARAVSFQNSVI